MPSTASPGAAFNLMKRGRGHRAALPDPAVVRVAGVPAGAEDEGPEGITGSAD